jgi:hypothetical protein
MRQPAEWACCVPQGLLVLVTCHVRQIAVCSAVVQDQAEGGQHAAQEAAGTH